MVGLWDEVCGKRQAPLPGKRQASPYGEGSGEGDDIIYY